LQTVSEGLFLQGQCTLHFTLKPAKTPLSAAEILVFLLASGDRQLPASALLQVARWLPLAQQQYALRINEQMQLRLRQAVVFLPKKSLHPHRRTLMTAIKLKWLLKSAANSALLKNFSVPSQKFNTAINKSTKKTIHSSGINLHTTPNKASWSRSFNTVLALRN